MVKKKQKGKKKASRGKKKRREKKQFAATKPSKRAMGKPRPKTRAQTRFGNKARGGEHVYVRQDERLAAGKEHSRNFG